VTWLQILLLSAMVMWVHSPPVAEGDECPVITVHYHERAPYMYGTPEGVKGLTAEPTREAFERSGVRIRWENTPSKRQMVLVQESQGCDCTLGWFRNPEREAFARFAGPVYRDSPLAGVARADNARVKGAHTVEELFALPGIRLLVKDGYSYGSYLDGLLEDFTGAIERTTTENLNMLRMIQAGRADLFFAAPEEACSLIQSLGTPQGEISLVRFRDIPQGENRYLMCSRRVDPDLIRRINQALETMGAQRSKDPCQNLTAPAQGD
jgi:uncharacterized protein (TIGR02285 family)